MLTRLFLEGIVVLFRIADNTSKIAASSQPQPQLYPAAAVDALGHRHRRWACAATDQVPARHAY